MFFLRRCHSEIRGALSWTSSWYRVSKKKKRWHLFLAAEENKERVVVDSEEEKKEKMKKPLLLSSSSFPKKCLGSTVLECATVLVGILIFFTKILVCQK